MEVYNLLYVLKLFFINKYEIFIMLGVDRIVLVSVVVFQFLKENVLIIDVGSCIIYDFLNFKNEYLGGVILFGIFM